MVDVIKIFIRSERLAVYDGHLSCIVTRILDIFSAAGHHQYVKGGRLYYQMMKQLENYPVTRTLWKVLLPTGTTLSVTLAMSYLVPGVTSVTSRR